MERETLLVIVASAFFGVVVWLFALSLGGRTRAGDPEALAWWRLVLPLFAGCVVLAFLFGWALQEPDPADERVGLALRLLAVVSFGILLRALVRSARVLRSSGGVRVSIGTVGWVKPRVVVSEEFRTIAPKTVFAAALAHESAHVRGRDPIRIWLAQLAADLQWPIRGTERRFSAWLLALEAARDDEALAAGTMPEDLAEAILTAAGLHVGLVPSGGPKTANAVGMGAGEGIAWRVRRLLSPQDPGRAPARPRTFGIVQASRAGLLMGAFYLGLFYGDALLGVLPGVGR
jgi:hypothetical protein